MTEQARQELDDNNANDWTISFRLVTIGEGLFASAKQRILESLVGSSPVITSVEKDRLFALTFSRHGVTEKIAVSSGIVAVWEALEAADQEQFRIMAAKLADNRVLDLDNTNRYKDVTLDVLDIERQLDKLRDDVSQFTGEDGTPPSST